MLSLDKQILDPKSRVAARMIEYGKTDELFIIIPYNERKEFDLSPSVHVFTSWGTSKLQQFWELYGVGERLLKKEKIDLITAQDPFFMGLTAVWLKMQFKLPLEIQLHGDFFSNNYYRFKSGPMNHLRWHIGKYVVCRADHVRAVGERVKQSLVKIRVSEEKITVRPVHIDSASIATYEPKFDLHERYPQFKKIFLALGRLAAVKNVLWLIDIFHEVVVNHPDWGLIIVGGGEEMKRYPLPVTRYKMEGNIKFESNTNDPWSYLKTTDCVLFPSLAEGYGLVPMEAHAAGTPVIMNDVGVANYELQSSDKVKIISVSNRDAWIQAMLSI